MVAPVSLIVTAFAPVSDVRKHLTPQLQAVEEPSYLLLFDLGQGRNRMGGILSRTGIQPRRRRDAGSR